MTPQPAPESPLEGLQFEKAEFAGGRQKCTACATKIESTYYHLAGQVICPACGRAASAAQGRPSNQWIARGALYGAGAAAACSAGYATITLVTGLELALVSILVGYLIGKAVRKGCHGLGGRRCQIIAVALTYLAITISYVPLIIKQIREQPPTEQASTAELAKAPAVTPPPPSLQRVAIAIGVITAIAFISPFLGLMNGISGILGVLIIFFGLSRAWQLTGRDDRLLLGPYELEERAAGA